MLEGIRKGRYCNLGCNGARGGLERKTMQIRMNDARGDKERKIL